MNIILVDGIGKNLRPVETKRIMTANKVKYEMKDNEYYYRDSILIE